MKFHIITLFPEMILESLKWGVIGKAQESGIYSVNMVNPRDFTDNVHHTVDDRPFGGGDGMVMLCEPLEKAIASIPNHAQCKKIYMSPAGRKLDETLVKKLSGEKEILILSGRYGGVDQRLLHSQGFMNVSIGDYVVSGGELPALVLMDAVLRKKEGVLGNNESANSDSFAAGPRFEAPLFTRPRENAAGAVPEILLSGDHKKIEEFRRHVSSALTLQHRPDLLQLTEGEKKELKIYLQKLSASDRGVLGISDDFIKGL